MAGILDIVFDRTINGLHKALDLTWRRNQAIASNIANAETPKYRAVDVSFASELNSAFQAETSPLKMTDARHLNIESSSHAHLIDDFSGATKADGNNVDLDIQMGRLTFNSGRYNAAANLMRNQLAIIKTAIREGGR